MGRMETATVEPKRTNPLYLSPEWRELVTSIIAERGRQCESPGCGRSNCRIFGDHVVELRDGGAPLDRRNVMLLCGSCHTTKTVRVRGERMRAR